MKKINPHWHQDVVIHCPDSECEGMLLQSIYVTPMKCSKCGRLWVEISRLVEVYALGVDTIE
jgi:hypothetical protein